MRVGRLHIGRSIALRLVLGGSRVRVTAWPLGPLWVTWEHR